MTPSRMLSCAAALGLLAAACTDPVGPSPLPPLADLPADLAAISFVTQGSMSVPYVMLELREPDGFRGFVAVNDAGRPVWFFRTVGSPFSFTRRANGNFVFHDSERGLVEVQTDGTVVRELAQAARPGRRIHHDVTATEHGTVLFIAEEWRQHGAALVNGEAIWEWHPESGAVTKRWSSFDALDPAVDRSARSHDGDWLHANSLAVGTRGNILMSLHYLDQVISISPDFASIEWRLGGTRADITVADPFSGQHTAQEVADGRILLFDNGYDRVTTPYSRAVEYSIAGATAEPVWQWRPERDNWARVISGTRRLDNGNSIVAFGTPLDMPPGATGPIEVYEVTRDGTARWHMQLGGAVSSMYRATPIRRF
jgi:hypothetical protein